MIDMFLSVDEDRPLAIFWADGAGCGTVDLDSFLNDSLIDMSKEQAQRYVAKLQEFVVTLKGAEE